MEIDLTNFKFHVKGHFEIPQEGLIALSGPSGTGKTSILNSIVYAFYGKMPGKIKKPYSHGKNTCKVEITYTPPDEEEPIHIVRTSRPNALAVTLSDIEYEDDAAQSVIEKFLGMNYQEFMVAAYTVQRSNSSVLSMTPTEQIKFVEVLADSTAIEEFKTNIKERIREMSTLRLKKQGELDGLNSQLEEKMSEQIEEPEVPQEILDGYDPSTLRQEIAKYQDKLKSIDGALVKARHLLEIAQNEEKEANNIRKKISKLEHEISVYKQLLSDSGPEISDEDVVRCEENLTNAQRILAEQKDKTAFYKEVLGFREAVAHHFDNLNAKLQALEGKIVTEEEILNMERERDNLLQLAYDYEVRKEKFVEMSDKKNSAKKQLSILFRQIRQDFRAPVDIKTPNKMFAFLGNLLKVSGKVFNCPSCSSNLCLNHDGEIIQIEGQNEGRVEDLTIDQVEKIRILIMQIENAGRDINVTLDDPGDVSPDPLPISKKIISVRRERDEYLAVKRSIENQELSHVLERMERRLIETKKFFGIDSDLREESFAMEEVDFSELEKQVENAREILQNIKNKQKEYKTNSDAIKTREMSIKNLMSKIQKGAISKSKKWESKCSKLTQFLVDTNMKISKRREMLDSMSEYETYQKYLEEVAVLEKRIKRTNAKLDEINDHLEGLYGLEETGKEAEILALEETVKSINEHARIYLDQMFEEPIFVRLQCVKERGGKKGLKLQMNTSIDYQGNTYQDIDELSGGERQRCDVAFLLAVNDMLGGKLLLLDECLNNLDSSVNTEVLALIRDSCSHKLIIVVSHEAIRGVFDSEVLVSRHV